MSWLAAAALCVAPSGAGPDASTQTNAYSQRSIQIAALARERKLDLLQKWVTPNAKFSLGRGDVGMPFAMGAEGAIAMMAMLKPATYVFSGWDYIPMQREVCGKQQVEVTFSTADGRSMALIKFQYEGGLLTSAEGWMRSRNAGRVGEKF